MAVLAYPILDLNTIDAFGCRSNESTKAMVEMMFSTILGNTSPTTDALAQYSSKNFVSAQTPPTLIVYSVSDDWDTLSQVHAYEKTCTENNVSVRLMQNKFGAQGDYTGTWVQEAINWIKSQT